MIKIGDIEIDFVMDGVFHTDAGGPFGLTPRALYQGTYPPDANNLVPMTINCLLVRANGKTIVVDTGLGGNLTEKQIRYWNLIRPQGTLIEGLAKHEIAPEDVDIVINTHLHGDHCGGNVILEGTTIRPAFPRAQYYTQRREYDEAMQPNERTRATYFPMNYRPLVESGQMHLLDGDTEIVPGITGVIARGHTPAHMCIQFSSHHQQALYMADLASFTVHLERLGWMTAFDVEPLYTLESKRKWASWAVEQDALILWEHDPLVRAGKLLHDGERYRVETVEPQPGWKS
jgi:glyoxylase-like metal-dependent hydrolase (beta-lactamase superfamily II)